MRKLIARILRWQAERYLSRAYVNTVVVTGSVGKTSTTQAIATVLSTERKVRKTIANYNTDLGVPCSIFAQRFPSNVKNPFGWVLIIVKNQLRLLSKPKFNSLVLELGTDTVGEIDSFSWLKPDVAVVTAVAPEHMEQFGSIETVAKEELATSKYSDKTYVNKRTVDSSFLQFADGEELYNYDRSDLNGVVTDEQLQVVGDHSKDALAAAYSVAQELGLSRSSIINGLQSVTSVNGRMRKLKGIKNATLIDDTYNASPEAVKAALDYIYKAKASQKIVLLGNMNELGDSSESEHTAIGQYCKPEELDLVVTLGPDANKYTAPAATEAGCLVAQSSTPYEAAELIKKQLKENALILLKGSQNAVFAEEAVKMLLATHADVEHLVRQSSFWARKKQQNFGEYKQYGEN